MKTKPTTRVSSSSDRASINIELPTSWQQLSQQELRCVFQIIDAFTADDDNVPFQVFRRLTGMRVERRDDDNGDFLVSFPTGHRRMRLRCWLSPEALAEHIEPLSFLSDPGEVPVRLGCIGFGMRKSYRAVNAMLHDVSFRNYIKLENLYQGFLSTHDVRDVLKIAAILYPGFRPETDKMHGYEALSIIQWLVQVKAMFARTFSHFFRPASSASATPPRMIDVLNNEIRALTQGDVTKEATILEIDCWRALTELNFKAREAEEFNRAKSTKK